MAYRGFTNTTPFAAELFLLADERGASVATVVAKASYALRGSALSLADEQAPLRAAPVHHGEAGASSLRFETEATFFKPSTDVVLHGHAVAERGRPTELEVRLRVGRIDKRVRVLGDRVWRKGLGSRLVPGDPKAFERVPLLYERAFGGWDRRGAPASHTFDPRNPVGVGFLGPEGDADGQAMPNLEDPGAPIQEPLDRPWPAGFGYVSPGWSPRRELAGTFDDAWQRERFPLLPLDFQRAHLGAAGAGLQARPYLRGGERVEVLNASVRGALRFDLPEQRLEAVVDLGEPAPRRAAMELDTLLIDADEHRVELTYRASLGIHRRLHDLSLVEARLLAKGTDAQR